MKLLKLGVTTINPAAIRCYSRCGFTVYGIEPKVIFANEAFYDELLMAKEIALSLRGLPAGGIEITTMKTQALCFRDIRVIPPSAPA